MTGYELSARWFAYCDENPEWVEPNVTALFFAIVQRSNELRWKRKFHLPTLNTMERIGIRSPKTYYPALDKLEKAGFIKLLERAKNQYTACIIELLHLESAEVENTEAPTEAAALAPTKSRHASVKFTPAPTGAPASAPGVAPNADVKNALAPTEASTEAPTSALLAGASAEVKNAEAPALAQETYINKKTKQTKEIYIPSLPSAETSDQPDPSDQPAKPESGGEAIPVPIDTAVKKNKGGQMIKPDLETLTAYVLTRPGGTVAMAETMFDFYASKGWKVGRSPMVDWNSAASKWVRENKPADPLTQQPPSGKKRLIV